jgi:hypothetical protein
MKSAIKLVPSPGNPRSVEVRCAVRFPLSLPIRVITEKGQYDATTENISASGVLFRSNEDLGVNSKVEFLLKMPASIIGTDDDVTLHCFGRVVRSYEAGHDFHAAAVIDDYLFSNKAV